MYLINIVALIMVIYYKFPIADMKITKYIRNKIKQDFNLRT